MKKLLALALVCALSLLCACSAADPAQIAAAKESGLAGTWYADMMGLTVVLNLNEDLSCSMEIDRDNFSYKGTWKVSEGGLSVQFKAVSKIDTSVIPMEEMPFVYDGETLSDGAGIFNFRREKTAVIEIAPVREDVTLRDFEGVWEAYLFDVNGFLTVFNGEPMSPSEMDAEMTVSVGTTSAAVDIPGRSDTLSFMEFANAMTSSDNAQALPTARPDVTYIFPLELVGNELNMTLDHMSMTARLHTDGTMSIRGRTPLHDTAFTEDAPLIVYLRKAEPAE